MRIKEFLITRYGPLVDMGCFLLTDFNLFFGRNEEGKTLLIDSIVRFLFKKQNKIFDKIDRVEETPEGYLHLAMEKGKEIKFPEKGELTEFTGLSAREYRNIFIIRSSDLSIDKEDSFYRNVQNRLTGLRTDEIERIDTRLLEIGKLTPKGDFRDIKDEKLRTKLSDAKILIEKIEGLAKKITDEGFERLEEELFNKKKSVETIEIELNDYENARKRETYEKCITAWNSLNKARNEFKHLENYNEKDEELWRDCERDIEKYKEKKVKFDKELAEKEEELKKKKSGLGKKEHEFLVYIDIKKRLDDDINPEVKNYEKRNQEFARAKVIRKVLTISEIIFGLLCGISIIGYIFRLSSFLKYSFLFFGVLTIIFLIVKIGFFWKKRGLAGSLEKIKLSTAKLGLSGESIDDIVFNIRRFQEEFSKMEKEHNCIEKDLEILETEIKKIEDEISELNMKINNSEKNIEGIKRKSGIELRDEYNKKLQRKKEQEKVKDKESGILKSYLGEGGKREKEKSQYWKKSIDEYSIYKDKAVGIDYNEKNSAHLKDKRNSLIEEVKGIQKRLNIFVEEIKEIEKAVNHKILMTSEEDYLHCKTTIDLNAIKERLEALIAENEQRREAVLNVKEIFEEIEKEEEKKVTSLFGGNSPVSAYFKKITKGMYKNVEYDTMDKSVKLLSENGELLSAEKLSSGAYDQLYLSIRLALGEKILKGEKGFFIMDDPFVKSDIDRLKRQLTILKELSKSGWQIIYLTAKDEVKDCLKDEIKNKEIAYFEI
ncbi:MAG: hypothetical protein E3J87_09160 [Candidatus Cloacimonadota bacterium]|nr:MAG: hypothetical protein E3J87_09160 [Candidatus Cloacimonadota bacterium]